MCVLALISIRDLTSDLQQPSPRLRAWFPAAAVVVAICALIAFAPFVGSQWEAAVPRGAVLLGRFHFLAVWSAVVGIGWMAWRLPSSLRPPGIPVLLVALASTDALLTSTLSIPTMFRLGSVREHWRVLDANHSPSLDLRTAGLLRQESACPRLPIADRCRRNDQMIMKIPVFNAYSTEKNPRHLAMVNHPVLR